MGNRSGIAWWLGGLFFAAGVPATTNAAIIYRDLGARQVAGQWTQQPDNTYQIQPTVFDLDIDHDAKPDLRLEHGYRQPFFTFTQKDADLLNKAHAGIAESLTTVQQIRPLAILAANAGVNDEDQFVALQEETDLALDHLERLAGHWSYQGRNLLDGSIGLYGISSDPNIAEVVKTTSATKIGDYAVTVKTPAERAIVAATTDQEYWLAQDEILSINGTNIDLFAGMSQHAVVDRINEYSLQTGAVADISGKTTRVFSTTFGSYASINIISNQADSDSSSGFGSVATNAAGNDAEISLGDAAIESFGRRVSVISGPADGIMVLMQITNEDPTTTAPEGAKFDVKVVDQSLDLLLLPDDSAGRLRVTLPSVNPISIGTGVANNQFAALNEIRLTSASQAQDSLAIIDSAVNELSEAEQQVGLLLERYHQPTGQAWISSGTGPSGAALAIDLAPLSEGQLVDGSTVFSGEPWSPDRTQMELAGVDSLFVGFRFSQDFATHYGWLRLGVDEEHRLTLYDVAYESTPGRGLRIGYVPEPSTLSLAALGLALLARLTFVRPD